MAPNAELTDLLVLLCDGEMGQAEWERFESLLLDDPAARSSTGVSIGLDVDLAWRAAGRTARLPFEAEDAEAATVDAALTAGAAVELPHQLDAELPHQLDAELPHQLGESPATSPQCPAPSPESPIPQPECLIPPIIIDTDLSSGSSFPSSLGGWAVLLRGRHGNHGHGDPGRLGIKVSHDDPTCQLRRRRSPSVQKTISGKASLVGRITGMADCRWADPQDVPAAPPSPWAASMRWPPG